MEEIRVSRLGRIEESSKAPLNAAPHAQHTLKTRQPVLGHPPTRRCHARPEQSRLSFQREPRKPPETQQLQPQCFLSDVREQVDVGLDHKLPNM